MAHGCSLSAPQGALFCRRLSIERPLTGFRHSAEDVVLRLPYEEEGGMLHTVRVPEYDFWKL